MCVCVCARVCVHADMGMQIPGEARGDGSPGVGVTGNCEPAQCRHWKLKSSALQKEKLLNHFYSPLCFCLLVWFGMEAFFGTWSSHSSLGCLPSEPQRASYLCLTNSRIIRVYHPQTKETPRQTSLPDSQQSCFPRMLI